MEFSTEWTARRDSIVKAISAEHEPKMDESEQKMYPKIQRFIEPMWEGGFGVEVVEVFE